MSFDESNIPDVQRRVAVYAQARNFLTGFCTFHADAVSNQRRLEVILFPSTSAKIHYERVADLGITDENDIPEVARRVAKLAQNLKDPSGKNYLTGFTTFHADNIGTGRRLEIILLPDDSTLAKIHYERVADLGITDENDIPEVARRVAKFAQDLKDPSGKNYLTGFTTFHADNIGTGRRLEIILFTQNVAALDYEFKLGLGIIGRFSFQPEINSSQRFKLIERHIFAVSRAIICDTLGDHKQKLLNAYTKAIDHGVSTDPNENASVPVPERSRINVNFSVLFPKGDIEIAQTLIHEMMHCAGEGLQSELDHPPRRLPPPGQSCAVPEHTFDCPFDGGPYYSSPPLQAELCIAGSQSDISNCMLNSRGEFTVYEKNT
ncbi:hypothetical protein [Brevibacillus fortis]|uniref:Lysine-specific metallo-endopeptidase domain-containing protein n=1 Tax=Brevibacillus fortis TaxID=2126352 RepID=A0A2P7VH12_9BACL|nr:hypothetical protein [Brevibacillus fortis]PSJ98526.1 hypothetical protein C7R93_06175 [Brevibacillus fortis]